MESKRGTETICRICDKTFSNKSARNKHLKKFHPDSSQDLQEKLKRIMCPLCQNNEKFSFYLDLNTHLSAIHTINVKESIFCFRNFVEFEEWRACENREVDYACRTRRTCPNGEVDIFYECNRSDSYGSANACSKRSLKTGGSIRIDGTCPSKINVRIHNTGEVTVKFTETHVGHIDELRTKRLSKGEQDLIVRQLEAGVSTDRIIQDARQIENETLKRKNLITRADLRYLMRKFNIDKKRHADDMIATCLKIEEWNREGKNNAFLFKKIGESYSTDSSSNEDVDETNLHIDVPSTTKLNYQDEVAHFIQENLSKADHVAKTTFEERREIAMAATLNFSRTLDEETFEVFMAGIMKLKNSILEKQDTGSACRKRKMEKQTYYPSKKPHHTNM